MGLFSAGRLSQLERRLSSRYAFRNRSFPGTTAFVIAMYCPVMRARTRAGMVGLIQSASDNAFKALGALGGYLDYWPSSQPHFCD